MNGKVSGFLNDVSLDEADLHAYVVTEDGRTYTAVSRVPDIVGSDLQVLFPLGGVVGWLFAVSRSGAPNGFSVTGGAFNRSAEIDFPGTGHHVLIEETFLGPDVFNYMRVRVKLRGSVPTVPAGAKIELSDYEEEYTRVSNGVIRSRSSRSYKLEGGGLEVPFTLDQTITFEECVPPMANTRLKVARNFVIYDANERIVRYAMTNKISPLTAGDPCAEAGLCPSNSHCVADGDSYRCVCAQGYQFLYGEDGNSCVDVDECTLGRDNCHVFAECTNLPGSFHCRCGQGYTGDGIDCQRRQTCADLNCDPHAECVEQGPQRLPMCRCRQGYTGDGIICRVTDQDDCMQNNYCDPRAECVYSHVDQRHECRCRPGYAGNGIVCVEDSCDVSQNCSPDGDCLFDVEGGAYYCACKPGFSGDGYVCLPEDECGHCHLNAHCSYDSQTQRQRCLCNTGYEGDGRNCIRIQEEEGCEDACSPHASCVRDEFFGKYECHCNEGFEGDGLTCRPVDECSTADHCDRNAQCVFEGTRYRCRCNTGYRGDGRTCEREPCETCHPRARCLYDPESRGYRCQCAVGLQGDGVLECRSCVDDHLMCDRNAECLPTGICRCLRGYVGDGLTCQESHGGHLVMAHGMSLLEIPSRPTKNDPGHLLLMEPNQTPVGLTTDCQRGRLFWADASLRLIRSANFDGSDVETILSEDMQSPEGVAVDWLARTIYWTDSGKDTIEVASLEQSFRKVLISEDLDNPRGIAVHPALGKLYWSDWRRSAPKIEMANMDGTERADLISHNLGLPNMIVIDYERNNLCWTDSGQGRIECIALNGQSRRVIYTPAAYPFGIAIHDGFIYWTDWEIKFLHRVDINGGEAEPLEVPAGGSGRMYGLVSLPSYCPSIGSACAAENGGCRYLCLPSGRGGRTCACPDIIEGETIGFECDNE